VEINREQQVKAAYLYNFARFTTWPSSKLPGEKAPIMFCVLADDPIAPAMDETLQGKEIDAHPVLVSKVHAPEEMRHCHVAYLGAAPPAQLALALQSLDGSSLLTVYDAETGQHDGMIRFVIEEHRLRFEINVAAAEREHVQLSSRLLGVARVVRE